MSASRASSVLVVDDESGIRGFLADVLGDAGYDVRQAGDGTEALAQLEDRPFDLMFLDLRMPGELGGMDVLRRARANYPAMQIIVLTAFGTVHVAVEAMRLGAFDFIEKPMQGPNELRRLAARALNWRRPADRAASYRAAANGDAHALPRAGGSVSRFSELLWQLKRRHVYHVAATYAAVGFLLLQVAELVTAALPLPGWSYPVTFILILGGFPVALLLGWLYDITATGVTRTHSSRSAA